MKKPTLTVNKIFPNQKERRKPYPKKYFNDEASCLKAYKKNTLEIHSYIWINIKQKKQKHIKLTKEKKLDIKNYIV